jgi:hypothetical protein
MSNVFPTTNNNGSERLRLNQKHWFLYHPPLNSECSINVKPYNSEYSRNCLYVVGGTFCPGVIYVPRAKVEITIIQELFLLVYDS